MTFKLELLFIFHLRFISERLYNDQLELTAWH